MKCPKCGEDSLYFYAFSFVPDCGVECKTCGFELESKVSWKDCKNEKEHDEKCYKHMVELIDLEF